MSTQQKIRQMVFSFDITGIDEGTAYSVSDIISIDIEQKDKNKITSVQLFVNNAFVDSDEKSPYRFKIVLKNFNILKKIIL